MERTVIHFNWENLESQEVFAKWQGFPGEQVSGMLDNKAYDLLLEVRVHTTCQQSAQMSCQ